MSIANLYINYAVQLAQRNNPIIEMASRIAAAVNMLLNYQSNVKLNKYRHNLYEQQLRRMEGFLTQGSPYTQYRGTRVDRKF